MSPDSQDSNCCASSAGRTTSRPWPFGTPKLTTWPASARLSHFRTESACTLSWAHHSMTVCTGWQTTSSSAPTVPGLGWTWLRSCRSCRCQSASSYPTRRKASPMGCAPAGSRPVRPAFAAFKNHLSYFPYSGSVPGQLSEQLGRFIRCQRLSALPDGRTAPRRARDHESSRGLREQPNPDRVLLRPPEEPLLGCTTGADRRLSEVVCR